MKAEYDLSTMKSHKNPYAPQKEFKPMNNYFVDVDVTDGNFKQSLTAIVTADSVELAESTACLVKSFIDEDNGWLVWKLPNKVKCLYSNLFYTATVREQIPLPDEDFETLAAYFGCAIYDKHQLEASGNYVEMLAAQ